MALATAVLPVLSPGELLFTRQGSSSSGYQQPDPRSSSSTFPSPPLGRYRRSPHYDHVDEFDDTDEELVWDRKALVWSRGAEIFRKLTFDHEDEDIATALFVWFKTGDEFEPAAKSARRPETGDARGIQSGGTFGPFHDPHQPPWGGPRSSSFSTPAAQIQRTLVVFLETRAHVYFASGEDVIVHLPFVVDKVWPLPKGGAMVQRTLEKRELRRFGQRKPKSLLRGIDQSSLTILDDLMDLEEEGAPDLPRLYTLDDPFEELKMVVEEREGGGFASIAGNSFGVHEPLEAHFTILHVADDPYPLVIAYNQASGDVIFYRRAFRPQGHNPTPPQPTTRTMHPDELLQQTNPVVPLRPNRPPLNRRPSSFQASDRRMSSAADPLDRTQRRAPRISRGHGRESTNGTGDLQAALEPSTLPGPSLAVSSKPVVRPRGASSASALAVERNRRVSGAEFMREDMVAPQGKVGLDRDLRETTMLMGLTKDEQQTRSDIILEKIWSWRPLAPFHPERCEVFLSENLSPTSVQINMHLSAPQPELHIFPVRISSNGQQITIRHAHSVPCISALPVLATRQRVLDTLALSSDGHLGLLTSGVQQIAVTLPSHAGDSRDEVARKLALSLSMIVPRQDDGGDEIPTHRPVGLIAGVGSTATIIFEDSEHLRISVDLYLRPGLALKCFEALSFALPTDAFFAFKRELISQIQALSEAQRSDTDVVWEVCSQTIRNMLGIPLAIQQETTLSRFSADPEQYVDPIIRRLARAARSSVPTGSVLSPPAAKSIYGAKLHAAHIPSTLLALHLVAQDCRLSSNRQAELRQLVPLVLDLAYLVGRWDWADYWKRILPVVSPATANGKASEAKKLTATAVSCDTSVLDKFDSPPDIIIYLARRLSTPIQPFPSPSTLLPNPIPSELGQVHPCAQTTLVVDIYDTLAPRSPPIPVADRARAMVELIIRRKVTPEWIADLPSGIVLPILEMLRVCQYHPPKGWSEDCYEFVGRTDLAKQSLKDYRNVEENSTGDPAAVLPTVGALMASISEAALKQKTYQPALPHVRFGSDRRVQEVERIMQTTACRTINVQDPRGASEAEIVQYHQSVVNTIAHRTLSLLVGRGMFEFGTRRTTITDVWPIMPIELSVKISPNNTLLSAQLVQEHADWPCFHNGVAAALSIAPDCKGITSSWIVVNRPAQLNPEHGGLLLGLGLSGHLKNLLTYHAFPYMEPRHDFTSVGLLLGLACSHAGSGDVLITKILSLHTHALLPMGSMELNASPIVQATSLVGLGILYAASRNLRMAEIALNEIGRRDIPGVDAFGDYQDAYSFSASASLGLIMLGRGGHASSEVDRRMLARLRRYILGDNTTMGGKDKGPDTTITSPCATLALGLMYLKSNRRDVAEILEVPQSAFALESVRPDLLLLRTFARALIMWDEITPSLGWIEGQLPPFIQDQHKAHKRHSAMELNTELAYLAIISGACFAIGLKYAGTATELAHNNLLFFFGVLVKAAQGQSMTYEGRIRRTAARQGLNVVTLALAAVMSGTGELNVLRRLRVSHGQEGAGVTYGSHMAMHMAIGILFLGRGYYTLGNSDLAIAAMAISFFPRFLASPADNRAYPQAFRHLWALAVEPRCLVARDVDSGETVYLPVKLKLREGSQTRQQSLISPTLIAPFESLISIDVDSPRYWPISYDLSNPHDREALVNTRTIYVKRKAGFLDYNSDPKGNRSIFVRAGSMTGFDMHYDLVSPAAPPGVSPSDVVELIQAHSADPLLVALATKFAGDGLFDAFVRTILLECVSLDKAHMVSVYMGMFASLSSSDYELLEHMAQIGLARAFYAAAVYDRHYLAPTAGGEKRAALIRPNFLFALARRVGGDKIVDAAVKATYLREGRWTDSPSDVDLAVFLARNGVPSASLLAALRDLVRADEEALTCVVTKVRDATRRYNQTLAQSWDAEGQAPVDIRAWKLDSAQEAVRLWRGADS